jgi:hypothetical protein
MKTRNHYENTHQKSLIKWARLQPEIGERLIHIANERKCTPAYGKHLREMGQVKGCFDLFLAYPIFVAISPSNAPLNVYSLAEKVGFWIELKSPKGIVSKSQLDFQASMQEAGYKAEIYRDWVSAAKAICDYLWMKYRGL